jgi:hypothetical protein
LRKVGHVNSPQLTQASAQIRHQQLQRYLGGTDRNSLFNLSARQVWSQDSLNNFGSPHA